MKLFVVIGLSGPEDDRLVRLVSAYDVSDLAHDHVDLCRIWLENNPPPDFRGREATVFGLGGKKPDEVSDLRAWERTNPYDRRMVYNGHLMDWSVDEVEFHEIWPWDDGPL